MIGAFFISMDELPIPFSLFEKEYEKLSLSPFYAEELYKIENFSIKKNYDDFIFHCNNLEFTSNHHHNSFIIDYFTKKIKILLEPKHELLFNILNKKIWIYDKNPYNFALDLRFKISTYCNFNFLDKKININGIKSLLIYIDQYLTINFYELNNKTDELLSNMIDNIKKLSLKLKENSNSTFEIENELMFKIFNPSRYSSLYQEDLSREEKIDLYFRSRKLL